MRIILLQDNVVASTNDKIKRNIPFSNGRKGIAKFLESSGLQYSSVSICTASGNKNRNRSFGNSLVRKCFMFRRKRAQVNKFLWFCRRCLQNKVNRKLYEVIMSQTHCLSLKHLSYLKCLVVTDPSRGPFPI